MTIVAVVFTNLRYLIESGTRLIVFDIASSRVAAISLLSISDNTILVINTW